MSAKEPVAESDVVGIWRTSYDGKVILGNGVDGKGFGDGYGEETLILKSDGAYEQSFKDDKGRDYPVTVSTWKLSRNPQDRQVVTLNGMRHYAEGVSQATASTPPVQTRLLIQADSKLPFGLGKQDLMLCFESVDLNVCFGRRESANQKQ